MFSKIDKNYIMNAWPSSRSCLLLVSETRRLHCSLAPISREGNRRLRRSRGPCVAQAGSTSCFSTGMFLRIICLVHFSLVMAGRGYNSDLGCIAHEAPVPYINRTDKVLYYHHTHKHVEGYIPAQMPDPLMTRFSQHPLAKRPSSQVLASSG
jgi:hypothetical protein